MASIKTNSSRKVLGITGSLVLFVWITQLAGCAQTPLRMYPPEPVDHYNLRSSTDNVKIGLKPVINRVELKNYLGTDIFSSGMLGIFVVIENTNDQISYLVTDSTFELGKNTEETNRGRASSTAGTAVVVGSLLTPLIIFPPVLFSGIAMANNASRKNLNIEQNNFPNGTLSPGETEQGFAYFQTPKDLSGNLVFTVKLRNLDTQEVVTSRFEFKLDMGER